MWKELQAGALSVNHHNFYMDRSHKEMYFSAYQYLQDSDQEDGARHFSFLVVPSDRQTGNSIWKWGETLSYEGGRALEQAS